MDLDGANESAAKCPLVDFCAHSSYTTHHTPLTSHHSSYTTHLTPLLRVLQLVREALCTAPATKSALQVHQALRPPRNLHGRQPRATRAAADPGGSAHCACHEICTPGSPTTIYTTGSRGQRRPCAPQLIQEALCTAPATKSALQVHQALRLPRNLHGRQPLRTAPATKYALQVSQALRLPRNLHGRQPRASGDHTLTKRCA